MVHQKKRRRKAFFSSARGEGLEGRESESAPVEHFPAPPLRPQAGEPLMVHQKKTIARAIVFFNEIHPYGWVKYRFAV